jgi:hypothetical protein
MFLFLVLACFEVTNKCFKIFTLKGKQCENSLVYLRFSHLFSVIFALYLLLRFLFHPVRPPGCRNQKEEGLENCPISNFGIPVLALRIYDIFSPFG